MLYSRNRFLFNEEATAGAGSEGSQNTGNAGANTGVDIKALEEKISALTNNSQKLVNEKRELEGKLKAIEDAKKIEEGKTGDLLKDREAELEQLKKDFDLNKSELEKANKFIADTKANLISQLPDDLKEIAEDLNDISKIQKLLAGVKDSAKVDNGGASSRSVKLTDAEKEDAKRLGVSDEDYLYIKEKRKKD